MKTILFNPFENYSEKQLLLFGFLLAIVASALSTLLNGRFDGVLDLHFVEKSTFIVAIIDMAIGISIQTFSLYIIGKIINKKTRLIDILSTCLIAKIPFYFLLFFNINNKMFVITHKLLDFLSQKKAINLETLDLSLLIFSGIATFMCLIWSVMLLYNGFKTATNVKETKHIILFILSIITAEVVSKIILFNLN
jgi:membrane protein DedA with SNARE-associated domain